VGAETKKTRVKQYDVWIAHLPEPIGKRPVLLLTRSSAYTYLSRVIVVEVTSSVRGIPQELALGRKDGLAKKCVANFDNLHVVPKASLITKAGRLAPGREREAKAALGAAFAWPELEPR
jgi:mRNA interferase MazF